MNELRIDGLPANVGIRILPLFCLSSLVNEVPVPVACGMILVLSVFRKSEFYEDDRGVNYQKTLYCNPDVFHVSRGRRLSRLSIERELGIIAS